MAIDLWLKLNRTVPHGHLSFARSRYTGTRAGPGAVALPASVLAALLATQPPLRAQPLPPPPSRGAPLQTVLFLELVVNERASGQIVQVLLRGGHYYVGAAALQALGVRTGTAPEADVAVDQIAGVTMVYDSIGQRLRITVPPDWLPAQTLGADELQRPFTAMSSTGALLNYDLYANRADHGAAQTSLLTEQRVFGPWGSLSNTGVYRHASRGDEQGYLRYDTRFTHADTDRVRSTTAGDLIAAPLSWGSAVRLGGLQVARNFGVRPDLVTYPLPRFSGQAAVPSAVDLFINGYRAGSESVEPGPFTLNTVPYINGAGEASVVTTDALGRQVVTTVPFYVANTLLKKGIDDYSLSLGALRRSYGRKNFDYGPPATSGAYRFGFSDALTLEGRAEAAPSLAVVGAGALRALGAAGVLNAALSRSQMHGASGSRLNLGYQYNGRHFGFGAQHTARSGAYADLTNYDTAGLRLSRHSSQVNTSFSMGDAGAIAAGYFDVQGADRQRTRLVSMSYSKPVGRQAFFSVNLNKAVGQRDLSLQFQLTFALDDRSMVSLTTVRDRDNTTAQVNYSRTPPTDGGFGWNLAYANNGSSGNYSQASGTWRTAVTQLHAGAYAQGRASATWFGANGSVVLMDGRVFPANRINDAFVLVSTNGVPNVPIRYENQVIGRTDAAGHMLVPGVPGFYPARIDVDVLELPDHMQIVQSSQRLTVRSGSGALLRFDIQKTLAARITLVDGQGRPLPVGWQVQHVQSGQNAVVGWDGLVYFEGLKAHNELLVRGPGNIACRVNFPIVADQPQVLRIGPLTCRPDAVAQTALADFKRLPGALPIWRH
ncbi:hypothetical protein RD110_14625 [Rhodoferax koreense]|uniref:PapC-like C-terminal domain-containing protein n=1 Tax=Rhodoferax koreensis TaxID=1842727 RepID=A0A1P8JX00_9BURK|nr:fimbria/pilus outer membrane usher protein [Rhodoferax koreense]APW38273.1 hypothetical protein RD110_14625 [Rhodoferax koreense]